MLIVIQTYLTLNDPADVDSRCTRDYFEGFNLRLDSFEYQNIGYANIISNEKYFD